MWVSDFKLLLHLISSKVYITNLYKVKKFCCLSICRSIKERNHKQIHPHTHLSEGCQLKISIGLAIDSRRRRKSCIARTFSRDKNQTKKQIDTSRRELKSKAEVVSKTKLKLRKKNQEKNSRKAQVEHRLSRGIRNRKKSIKIVSTKKQVCKKQGKSNQTNQSIN